MTFFRPSRSNVMNGITSRRGMLLSAIAATCLAAIPAQAQQPEAKRVKIVASFTILADIAKSVAGDRATITSLVGPNGDAHVYRATPADAKTLKEADLVVVNGLGFEGFMPRLIKSSGTKAPVITVTTGFKPLEKPKKAAGGHDHGHDHDHGAKADPHTWQSIEAAKRAVINIRDGLVAIDAAGGDTYRRNAEAYLASLSALKAELDAGFTAIPQEKRVIVTSHDAFRYFAVDFGFRMEAVQGVSTESEPSAKDVARIIRVTKEKKARAIFIENMANPKIAEQIARESGAKIGGTLFSDALSDEKGPAPTYIAMMKHNAKMLIDALKD
ncbi:MAG: zinc/manganese transport system substrate-binding [Beijerinckiaceae bacterium]|nr:MAG: zinc/manganese transport system substrate-binding [Beijerinckiaceae bacterium]